jgi:hypothetical protein
MMALESGSVMKGLIDSWPRLLVHLLQAVILWSTIVVVYRRYFHPLAKIPGPFLPGVTRLCIWYYSFVQEGQLYKRIAEWHETYGKLTNTAPSLPLASLSTNHPQDP